MARGARLCNAPRTMKERHIRMELVHGSLHVPMRCVGWDWAGRCAELALMQGSRVDVAYKIRENEHPDFGGIEIEIAGIRHAE